MQEEYKEYLGDGVYVKFDGYNIVLYLDNGYGAHSEIALEPNVIQTLEWYIQKLKKTLGNI